MQAGHHYKHGSPGKVQILPAFSVRLKIGPNKRWISGLRSLPKMATKEKLRQRPDSKWLPSDGYKNHR